MIGVNPRTIRRYIAAGHLAAFRLPSGRALRVPVSAIESLVNSGTAGGTSK
ncbi:helix-turn-helix domain-containing protein [Rhodococcus pyridinivorans]|uniref:Helix-turn-helix domain-containing protein n=2 Tax=Rhodococcus pyridinivorans TaxID=103816 RepID=A0A7M2XUR0_9NOCA|nr:helix-turn-helix domain-containing protein [Rhodococcus pyridinivorans]